LSIPIPLFKPLRLQGTGAFLSFVEFTAWLRASGTLNQVEDDTPPVLPRGLCIHYKRSGFTHPHVSLLRCCAFLLPLHLFLSPRALFCHREDFLLCHCGVSLLSLRGALSLSLRAKRSSPAAFFAVASEAKQSEIASPNEQTRLAMTLFVGHCEGQRPEAISQLRLLRR
jgi:hypothetical protein